MHHRRVTSHPAEQRQLGPHQPITLQAHTTQQARLLLSEGYVTVLSALLDTPRGASEVAQVAGLPLKAAHYRLTRLERAGLTHVVGQRGRGGRPIKLYRAAAQRYHVPMHLTSAADGEEWISTLLGPLHLQTYQAVGQHFCNSALEIVVERTLAGHLAHNLRPMSAPPASEPATEPATYGALYAVGKIHLTPEVAAEYERRLRELQRWATQQAVRSAPEADGRRPYLFTLGLLPAER